MVGSHQHMSCVRADGMEARTLSHDRTPALMPSDPEQLNLPQFTRPDAVLKPASNLLQVIDALHGFSGSSQRLFPPAEVGAAGEVGAALENAIVIAPLDLCDPKVGFLLGVELQQALIDFLERIVEVDCGTVG